MDQVLTILADCYRRWALAFPAGCWRGCGWVFTLYIRSSHCSGEGNGIPLQYSCLENPMDRGAWWARVHGVAKSRTRLSDFTFTFHFHALEKEMATHSSVLAWRIPGMGEPGGPPSMGSHRVRLGWSDLAAAAAWERLIMPSLEISVSHSIKWFKWHYKSFMRIPISSKHYLKVKIKI